MRKAELVRDLNLPFVIKTLDDRCLYFFECDTFVRLASGSTSIPGIKSKSIYFWTDPKDLPLCWLCRELYPSNRFCILTNQLVNGLPVLSFGGKIEKELELNFRNFDNSSNPNLHVVYSDLIKPLLFFHAFNLLPENFDVTHLGLLDAVLASDIRRGYEPGLFYNWLRDNL